MPFVEMLFNKFSLDEMYLMKHHLMKNHFLIFRLFKTHTKKVLKDQKMDLENLIQDP